MNELSTQKTNKRNLENKIITKDALINALFILLKDNNINNIKIVELVKKAGVSRTAFYRNYHNTEEVLLDGINTLIDEIINSLKKNKITTWETILEILKKYKFYLTILYNNNYLYLILEQFNNQFKNDYYMASWGGIVYNILNIWLKDNMKTPSKEIIKQIKKANLKMANTILNNNIFTKERDKN